MKPREISKPKRLRPVEKVAKPSTAGVTDITALVQEKFNLDAQIKILKERKAEITERVKDIAESMGVKDVKTGSFNYMTTIDGKQYVISKQARTQVTLNVENLKTFLSTTLPKHKDKVILSKSVDCVDEDALEQLIVSNVIKAKDLDKFRDVSTTFAGILREVKEGEELIDYSAKSKDKPKPKESQPMPSVVKSARKLKRGGAR